MKPLPLSRAVLRNRPIAHPDEANREDYTVIEVSTRVVPIRGNAWAAVWHLSRRSHRCGLFVDTGALAPEEVASTIATTVIGRNI
jgi:hypothetical protein